MIATQQRQFRLAASSFAVVLVPGVLFGQSETGSPQQHFRDLLRHEEYDRTVAEARAWLNTEGLVTPSQPENRATILTHLADALSQTDHVKEARLAIDEAVQLYEFMAAQRTPAFAHSIKVRGQVEIFEYDLLGAEEDLVRAIRIYESIEELDDDAAEAILNLALLRKVAEDFDGALELTLEASAILRESNSPELATAENDLGLLLQRRGDYDGALSHYNKALDIRIRESPFTKHVGEILNNLGSLDEEKGDLVAALDQYKRATALWGRLGGAGASELPIAWNNEGLVRLKLGQAGAAAELFQRALGAYVAAGDRRSAATVQTNLGSAYGSTGDYDGASRAFEAALQLLKTLSIPGETDTATVLHDYACMFVETGEIPRALELATRARQIWETQSEEYGLAIADSMELEAVAAQELGDLERARHLFESVIATRTRVLGSRHPDVALGKYHLARALFEEGSMQASLTLALESAELGELWLRDVARRLPVERALDLPRDDAQAMDIAVSIGVSSRKPPVARLVWDRVIASRALLIDEAALRSRAVAMGKQDPRIERIRRDLVESSNRLARLAMGRSAFYGSNSDVSFDAVLRERERLVQELSRARDPNSGAGNTDHGTIDRVLSKFGPGVGMVAYVRYRRVLPGRHATPSGEMPRPHGRNRTVASYAAFVAGPSAGSVSLVDLGPAARIDSLVDAWRSCQDSIGTGPGQCTKSRMRGVELREAVWAPMATLLRDAERVLVVPDGELGAINIAALPSRSGGYLVEDGPIFQFLGAERDLLREIVPAEDGDTLVVGNPDYSMAPTTNVVAESHSSPDPREPRLARLRFLPLAEEEAVQVAQLWRDSTKTNVTLLTDVAATEESVREKMEQSRVIHLATHGFYFEEPRNDFYGGVRVDGGFTGGVTPLLLSGIAFSGANKSGAARSGGSDGILSAEEIASLNLRRDSMVVLSSCESALGQVHVGEGLIGLRRSFQIAGAQTLVLGLWRVDDLSARQWMRMFHAALLKEGLDPAAAAKRAGQRILALRRKSGLSTEPFYWAGFVVEGNGR